MSALLVGYVAWRISEGAALWATSARFVLVASILSVLAPRARAAVR